MRISNDTEGLRDREKQGVAALGFARHRRSDRLDIRMSVVTLTVRLDLVMIHVAFGFLATEERASTQRMTSRLPTVRIHWYREATSTSFDLERGPVGSLLLNRTFRVAITAMNRIVVALPLHSRIDNHWTWNDTIASI